MKRRSVRSLVAVLVVGAAVTAIALAGGSSGSARASHAVGIQRAASSAVQQTSSASTQQTTGSFGPHVGTAQFQGVSPVVASLPVVKAPVVTTLNLRDSEHLTAAKGTSPNAKDPKIQKKRGTGPLSAPIANFDGICLPFGAPSAEGSSCSCLPPDTNGAAGATQR